MASSTEIRCTFSELERVRIVQRPLLPAVLASPVLECEDQQGTALPEEHEKIQALFPQTFGRPRVVLRPTSAVFVPRALRVAVCLSGGQAPGGHNVIAGIYDAIKTSSADSVMLGFLDGPHGIYSGHYAVVDDAMMDAYRNTGGFDMIGSGRHKIETPEEFAQSKQWCEQLQLDGLVIIGGDDSNTNAAVLAEYFEQNRCPTRVIGCPKTIDGDLKNEFIHTSFGFDTACMTYSELIGNLGHDTLSSQKYYHFVRLMGRAASNIALECALQTRPNMCLISEEVAKDKMTLAQVTKQVVDMIVQRAEQGKNYGIVLLPEGLIEFIPEFNELISNINDVLATGVQPTEAAVLGELSFNNQAVFSYLPESIKQQLLLDRDPHGNVQVAKIETEKLLADTVHGELEKMKRHGQYSGVFKPQFHSYGYEGRSGLPSEFDTIYCYALGRTAGQLILNGKTALMSCVTGLCGPVRDWSCGGVPVTTMMTIEKRKGKFKPVIKKALVELDGKPFLTFAEQRNVWAQYDLYRNPGPIQFFTSDPSTALSVSITMALEQLGVDARMDPADLRSCVESQQAAPRLGKFLHLASTTRTCKLSALLAARAQQTAIPLAPTLTGGAFAAAVVEKQPTQCPSAHDQEIMQRLFPRTYGAKIVEVARSVAGATAHPQLPLRVGVCFSGRQAPGGHNVIAGLLDSFGPSEVEVIGFVGGTVGLFNSHTVTVTPELLAPFRNQGGIELLGRSLDRIQSSADLEAALRTCTQLQLDSLLIVGGVRSNTDAAYLAEYFKEMGSTIGVCGVPVSIDGCMTGNFVETSVGFDTACRVDAQIVGNTATDAASAKKYYYFMRLMGQTPSHMALEVALQTKPNMVILAEEVKEHNKTLSDVVREIADLICSRANQGKNYGTVIIPEGLVSAIPELALLMEELNKLHLQFGSTTLSEAEISAHLTSWSAALLRTLPPFIQSQLMQERQSDLGIQLSQVETERMLAHFVELELSRRAKVKQYNGKFSVVCSFIGYQARGSIPTLFDCTYAYNLGAAAAVLAVGGYSGYLATLTGLKGDVSGWSVRGVPLTALMKADNVERLNGGQTRPRIMSSKVDLRSEPYLTYARNKVSWAISDAYENPGPIQFSGPVADCRPLTLTLTSHTYLQDIQALEHALAEIHRACRPGCSSTLLQIATKSLTTLCEVVQMVHHEASVPVPGLSNPVQGGLVSALSGSI